MLKLLKKYSQSISIGIFVICVIIFFLIIPFANFKELFNSDLLYGHSLYKDIFVNHISLSGWSTPPSTYIFPDLFILFPLIFLFGNTLATMIYGIIQSAVILYLINKLLKRFDFKYIPYFNLLFSLIVLSSAVSQSLYPIFFNLFIPTVHAGGFLLSLLALNLFLDISKNFSSKKLVFLLLVIVLGIISDLLFVVVFIIPFILTILYFRKSFPSYQ